MGRGKTENGQSLGHIVLDPIGKLWSFDLKLFDHLLESFLSFGQIWRVKNGANGLSDFSPHVHLGNKGLGILLKVKLAALPGSARKACQTGLAQSGMAVASNESNPTQAACDEAVKEIAPMDFSFAQRDADP